MSDLFSQIKIRQLFGYLAVWFVLTVVLALVVVMTTSITATDPIMMTFYTGSLYGALLVFMVRRFNGVGVTLTSQFLSPVHNPVRGIYLLGIVVFLILFSMAAFSALYGALAFPFPEYVSGLLHNNVIAASLASESPLWLKIVDAVILCLVGPVTEELIFRGFLMNRIAVKTNLNRGIVVSSLLFAVLHENILGAFVFGAAMCLVFVRTRSLHASILVHVLNNTAALLIAGVEFGAGGNSGSTPESLKQGFAWGLVGFLPLIGLLVWLTKRYYPGVFRGKSVMVALL